MSQFPLHKLNLTADYRISTKPTLKRHRIKGTLKEIFLGVLEETWHQRFFTTLLKRILIRHSWAPVFTTLYRTAPEFSFPTPNMYQCLLRTCPECNKLVRSPESTEGENQFLKVVLWHQHTLHLGRPMCCLISTHLRREHVFMYTYEHVHTHKHVH